MLYIGQVILYTAFMFLVYLLLLRNKPIHHFNRLYLLSSLVLPLVIPFIKVPAMVYNAAPVVSALHLELPEVVVAKNAQPDVMTFENVFWSMYVIGSTMMLVLLVYQLVKLATIIRKYRGGMEEGSMILYNTGFGPGSWMKYIFLPEDEVNETIIKHEAEHVRLKHSWDILLVNLIRVVFWPNIFLVWLKRELVQVHEFQADAAAKMDETAYSQLLLSTIFNTCTPPLSHSFIIHPLKRRIMMLKKSNGKTPYLAAALACITSVFLVFNFLGLQSCKRKTWEADKANVNKPTTAVIPTGYETTELDKQPECPYNMMQLLAENLVYPKEAMEKRIEARVKVHFIIDEEGKVTDIIGEESTYNYVYAGGEEKNSPAWRGRAKDATHEDVQKNMLVMNSFTTAATNALKSLPPWIPGEKNGKKVRVKMVQPISFKL